MTDDLKKLGIALGEPSLIEKHYSDLKGVLIPNGKIDAGRGLYLDLNSLPTKPIDLKAAFIKWVVHVNLTLINRGELPVITLELALKCPIWRVVKPPLKRLQLTKEGAFNRPKVKTIGQKASPGSINKR